MRHEQTAVTTLVGLGLEAVITLLLGTMLLEEVTSLAKRVGVGLVLGASFS